MQADVSKETFVIHLIHKRRRDCSVTCRSLFPLMSDAYHHSRLASVSTSRRRRHHNLTHATAIDHYSNIFATIDGRAVGAILIEGLAVARRRVEEYSPQAPLTTAFGWNICRTWFTPIASKSGTKRRARSSRRSRSRPTAPSPRPHGTRRYASVRASF